MLRRLASACLASLLLVTVLAGCKLALSGPDWTLRAQFYPDGTPLPLAKPQTAPGGPGRTIYPLVLGNRWHYEREFSLATYPETGPPTIEHFASAVERLLFCEFATGSRTYLAERARETWPGGASDRWVYFRQDGEGLYELDDTFTPPCALPYPLVGGSRGAPNGRAASLAATPADPGLPRWETPSDPMLRELRARLASTRAALGWDAPLAPDQGELVRLGYPLHAGSEWTIRPDPRFSARVEGVDPLELAFGRVVGYRIRITSELFGPHDRVLVWYGRQGFLRLAAHLEIEGTDPDGHHETAIIEDSETLDDLSLDGDPRF